MHSLIPMSGILYASAIVAGSFVAAAPLCNNTTAAAGGSLPDASTEISISSSAVKGFQLALFLENLEVSFFQTGLTNIKEWSTNGYPNDTIEIVAGVVAQEKVHAATIIDLLGIYDATPIPSCNYSFPVNSTREFFEIANIITSVSISATVGLAKGLAVTDPLLIQSVSSILTVEARHDAFFRHLEGKVPNPAPFDTGISDIWAYNLALSFIVPGSCCVEIPLPILPVLNVSSPIATNFTKSFLREFEWDPAQMTFVTEAGKQLLVGWVNQLNAPVYTPLNITGNGKGTAAAPPGMNGVAFAVVTTQQPDNADDLALATLAGPVVLTLS